MFGRGFVRVIEIVIFSFIVFGILLPSFFHLPAENKFHLINGKTLCNDFLFSMRLTNILDDALITDPFTDSNKLREEHEFDMQMLSEITRRVFPPNIDYEYEVKNVAPYKISVGCNCTDEQLLWLKHKILTPSYPTAEFALSKVSLSNLSDKYDVFVIFGDVNLSNYRQNIEKMLKKGKGFVLVRNIYSEPDPFTEELFGIEYSDVHISGNEFRFNGLSKPEIAGMAKRYINNLIRIFTPRSDGNIGYLNLRNKTYYVLQNSTDNCTFIQNCSDCLHEGETCTIEDVANITLYQIDPLIFNFTRVRGWSDIKLSGISNKRDYVFKYDFPQTVYKNDYTILTDGLYSAANARILQEYCSEYDSKPRTFWIYDFDREKDDLNLFFKTGLIWASGEHYFVFNKKIPEDAESCMHFYSGLRGNNIPFFIKLYYWGY